MKVLLFSYGDPFTAPYTDEIAKAISCTGAECIIVETSAVAAFSPSRFKSYDKRFLYLSERGLDFLPTIGVREYTNSVGDDLDFLGIRSLELFRRAYSVSDDLFDPNNITEGRFRFLALRVDSMLRIVGPDVVCIAHGADMWTKVVAAKARLLKIPCLYWESSFFPGRVLFDVCGPHFLPGASDMSNAGLAQHADYDPQQLAQAESFIKEWALRSVSKHDQITQDEVLGIVHRFRARYKEVIFVPMQIPGDAAVFGSAVYYDNQFLFFADIVDSVSPDVGIVFKVHPFLDKNFDWSPYIHIFERPNVLKICDVSIWELIHMSVVTVTFSSNVGLEAAMLGKAVVVGGAPVYSGHEFTLDRSNYNHLGDLIDRAMGYSPERLPVLRFVNDILHNNLLTVGDVPAMKRLLVRALMQDSPKGSIAAPFEEFDPPAARECLNNIRQVRSSS